MKTNQITLLGLLVLAAISISCGQDDLPAVQPAANVRRNVPLNVLVDVPSNYDGLPLRVAGVCRIEFEGNALYLDRQALEKRDGGKAVWLDLGWPVSSDLRALDGSYVVVEGRFDARRQGHFGAFRGTVTAIQRIERSAPDSWERVPDYRR